MELKELQKVYLEPKRLRLTTRLRDHVDQTEGKHGYQILNSKDTNWYLCAQIALEELQHLRKATALCFAIARRIAFWQGWLIDGRSHLKLGGYCLEQIILEGWAWIEWYPDKKDNVVMIRDEVLKKTPKLNAYTPPEPFPYWTGAYSEDGKQLVKPSQWTQWEPPDWHFTGKAPSSGERRVWHPFIERRFRDDDSSYKDLGSPLNWVWAIHKLESNKYQINTTMLNLVKDLKEKLIAEEEEQEKFDRIQIEADRLKDSIFYQRCHLDYRGRIYLSKSTISYQGDDLERSLIEFGEGVPLDDVFVPCLDETNSYPISEGFKWLLLHAATLYEIPFDKSQLLSSTITDNEDEAEEVASSISLQRSFDGSSPITYQRIEVALKHLDQWVAYGTNPVETYPEWTRNSEGDLDDPLQFIRVCMELRNILEHENKQIVKKKNKCSDKWTPNAVRSNLKEELIQSELDQDGRGVQEIMAKHLNLPTPFV